MPRTLNSKICSIEGCGAKHRSRGLCYVHYTRWLVHGDPHTNNRDKGGVSKHPLYRAWTAMIARCNNPNTKSFHQYGGLGIKVCDRWRDFRNFLEDMGERPEGKTLDRIDPLGNYEPSNCRWATAAEQRANLSDDGKARQRAGASAGAARKWAKIRAEKTG